MSASLLPPRLVQVPAQVPVAADAQADTRDADDAGRLSFADPAVGAAALLAGGIVFIGARFVVAPATAAAGFGVPAVRVPVAAVLPGGAAAASLRRAVGRALRRARGPRRLLLDEGRPRRGLGAHD